MAAIEEAFIKYFKLSGTEAMKMRGRAAPDLKEVIEEPRLKDDLKYDEVKRMHMLTHTALVWSHPTTQR